MHRNAGLADLLELILRMAVPETAWHGGPGFAVFRPLCVVGYLGNFAP